jgi:predicted peptidase
MTPAATAIRTFFEVMVKSPCLRLCDEEEFIMLLTPRLCGSTICVAGVLMFLAAAVHTQDPGTVVAADKRVQGKSYLFKETGKQVPYALFVPSKYDASRKWPLIVGLHGLGRPYDWVMGYDGIIDFAERDGFVMVTPLGYHPRSWYGSRGANPEGSAQPSGRGGEPLPPNAGELGEKDVMNVLEIARKDFNIDPDRIYLWGHSMGGAGTYHIASKYPDIWAGLAVAAPAPSPSSGVQPEALEKFKHIPILVLQGDADTSVPVARTREWVARMKQIGMEHVYIEVKAGDHTNFIARDREMLSKVFSFFNVARKNQ